MSLGPAEVLVILVVALIVFGPKRLPEVSRQVGGALRELRKVQESVTSELHSVLNDDGPDRQVPGTVHEIEAGADHDVVSGAPEPPKNLDDPDHGPAGSFS